MAEYGIQSAAFGQAIHIGRINKAGDAFTSKQDATDDALFAVARFVYKNFGGHMSMTFTGKDDASDDFELIVKVTPSPNANDARTEEA